MIVLTLAPGRMRLKVLHERVPGISTGVLDRHIRVMVALGLVTRRRFKETPPRVELELTTAGRDLLPIVGALARWAMRHLWSGPKAGEHVRVDVVLRMLPALLEDAHDLPAGSLDAVLIDEDGREEHVRYVVQDGRLQLDGPNDTPAAAVVHGDAAAWIAALSPERDLSTLRFAGEERLARALLDALPHPARQAGASA